LVVRSQNENRPSWDYENRFLSNLCFWQFRALSSRFCKAINFFVVHQAHVDALPTLFLLNTFCICLLSLFTTSILIDSPFFVVELAFLDSSVTVFRSKVFEGHP
jgi:hypothetical protein